MTRALRKHAPTAFAAAALTIICMAVPSSAVAADTAPPVDIETTSLDVVDLAAGSVDPAVGTERAEAVEDYVARQARSGRLVDQATTEVSVTDEVTAVWDQGLEVSQVIVAEPAADQAVAGGDQLEVAVESVVVDDADIVAIPAVTGLGLEVTSSLRGGTRLSGACVSTVVSSNTSTSCFAKYRTSYSTSTTDYFYYERWATGTGKAASGGLREYSPAVIDIRSRPWVGTAVTYTKSLVDYWPRSGSVGCSGSGSVGFSAVGLSATVPVQDCGATTPIPNATSKTMGVIYDQGSWVSSRARTASFGMAVGMTKGRVASMADYTYMKFCLVNACLNQTGNLRKDAGW